MFVILNPSPDATLSETNSSDLKLRVNFMKNLIESIP